MQIPRRHLNTFCKFLQKGGYKLTSNHEVLKVKKNKIEFLIVPINLLNLDNGFFIDGKNKEDGNKKFHIYLDKLSRNYPSFLNDLKEDILRNSVVLLC